jgi:hypothetical protein
LSALDDARTLDRYVHVRVLAAYLRDLRRARPSAQSVSMPEALRALLEHVAVLGHATAHDASAAFAAGWSRITAAPAAEATLERTRLIPDFARLDAALERLADATPTLKRRALVAVLATIEHDGRVAPAEVELCRAVAVTLDCPMPPAVELAGSAGGARQIR